MGEWVKWVEAPHFNSFTNSALFNDLNGNHLTAVQPISCPQWRTRGKRVLDVWHEKVSNIRVVGTMLMFSRVPWVRHF